MKVKTIIEITKEDLVKLVQEKYNQEKGQNHSFTLVNTNVPDKIQLELKSWNKDEVGR